MLLGVDYYPEQWDDGLMEADMDRILELGCNVIRIGEFAWHRMEKQEGMYDFSYFDQVIAMARRKGLQVVFGTPTATPPAWLVNKYPDILSQFPDGTQRAFGGRHVACYSNPHYLEACRQIITALAQHYRDEDTIVAWQVDNEIGHEGSDLCWCPCCRDAFRRLLPASLLRQLPGRQSDRPYPLACRRLRLRLQEPRSPQRSRREKPLPPGPPRR